MYESDVLAIFVDEQCEIADQYEPTATHGKYLPLPEGISPYYNPLTERWMIHFRTEDCTAVEDPSSECLYDDVYRDMRECAQPPKPFWNPETSQWEDKYGNPLSESCTVPKLDDTFGPNMDQVQLYRGFGDILIKPEDSPPLEDEEKSKLREVYY